MAGHCTPIVVVDLWTTRKNRGIEPRFYSLSKKYDFSLGPSDEGKRSAVAVVNASPVDWQSHDWIARRRLAAEQADWGRESQKV